MVLVTGAPSLSHAPRSHVTGSSAERGAATAARSGGAARRGSAEVSHPSRSTLEVEEEPGLMSTTIVSHQPEEQPAWAHRPAAQPGRGKRTL